MTDNRKHPDDVVPKEELRELIRKWRMESNLNDIADSENIDQGEQLAATVLSDCAEELEELL
jgi:hypothetical protein